MKNVFMVVVVVFVIKFFIKGGEEKCIIEILFIGLIELFFNVELYSSLDFKCFVLSKRGDLWVI